VHETAKRSEPSAIYLSYTELAASARLGCACRLKVLNNHLKNCVSHVEPI